MSLKPSKEFKTAIIIILVLTIVFSYNDNNPKFIPQLWLANFFLIFLLTALSFFAILLAYKLAAYYYESQAQVRLAYITRLWFAREAELKRGPLSNKGIKKIYLGIILAVFLALISFGRFFLTLIYSFDSTTSRIGHRWRVVTQFQEAVISSAGLFASLLLLLFFTLLHIRQGVTINTWLIIWNLVPIGTLPGGKIFFGSRTYYTLILSFFVLTLFLLPYIPIILAIIIAVILALAIAFFFFKKVEYS